MPEIIILPTREEQVEKVRQEAGGTFNGSWFDAAPDTYRGAIDLEAVTKEAPVPSWGVGRNIVPLVVTPIIAPEDLASLQRFGLYADSVRSVKDNQETGTTTMHLEAPEFEPPKTTASAVLDSLNHVTDYHHQVGVYDPARTARSTVQHEAQPERVS